MTEEYECRCGCRFAYELGKYGCPNCGADNGPADLVAGMSNTLVGRVMGAIAEYRRHAFGESDEPMQVEPDEEEMIRFAIGSDIIDIVTAARDAEIAEALLSSSMHDAVDEHLHGVVANGWLREVFRAGLDHIGLGDGTGGQEDDHE